MAALCITQAINQAQCIIPLFDADYPRILLMLHQGYGHGSEGGYGIIIAVVCQSSARHLVNHFRLSFGLDDRLADPYCDRFL